jgi:hypothetical protein
MDTRGRFDAPMDWSVIENEQIAELEAAVARLAARVEALEGQRRRGSRVGLLEAIALAARGRAFTGVELLEHAQDDPQLGAALEVAQVHTPKALGRALLALERRGAVDGWRLARLGVDRNGVVWLVRTESPDPQTR